MGVRGEGAGGAWEVARVFLRLGLTSFGGPSAHVGHFRAELVTRRGWVDEGVFAGWLGLCQFLPGPASTQLAFCLGWARAGWLGGWVAFLAFAAPSAVGMALLGWWLPGWDGRWAEAAMHGLKLGAWAVVGHAAWGMARGVASGPVEAAVALATAWVAWRWPEGWLQPWLVLGGAVAGWLGSRRVACGVASPALAGLRPGLAWGCLVVALGLLVASPAWGRGKVGELGAAMYRAGALVFGGGHVVLPFLEEAVVRPGWITRDEFLSGYGAAQGMPGPMFTLASYLGMRVAGWAGAWAGVLAIFLPGLLMVSALAPWWAWLSGRTWAARAVSGACGSVVGLLAAAWMGPVWGGAIHGWGDGLMGVAALAALASGRVGVVGVLAGCVAGSVARAWALGG